MFLAVKLYCKFKEKLKKDLQIKKKALNLHHQNKTDL